jgi:hypothetical protein
MLLVVQHNVVVAAHYVVDEANEPCHSRILQHSWLVYTERSDMNCEVTQACVLRLAYESGLDQLNIKALFYWWVFCVLVTSLAITVTMTTNVPAFVSVLSCLWSLRMGCHAHAFQSAMLSFMAVMTEKWLAEAISEIVVVVWIPYDQAVDIGRCDYLPW